MGQIGGTCIKYVSSNALLDIVQIELLCGGTWRWWSHEWQIVTDNPHKMLYEGRDPHIILKMGDDPHKMEHLETVADWAGGTSRNILEKLQLL